MREFLEDALPVVLTVFIVVLIVAGIAAAAIYLRPKMEAYEAQRHEERVTLCMRAYEFSRDRCEFILSNGGRDLTEGRH